MLLEGKIIFLIVRTLVRMRRSMTFGGGGDSSWLSSPNTKMLNGFIKSATISIATRAKKAASEIAKDLNDTMRDSIAYYTNNEVG